jgi:hypothetical protein
MSGWQVPFATHDPLQQLQPRSMHEELDSLHSEPFG